MIAPLTIEIGDLVVPGSTRADGALVAEATRLELNRLFLTDRQAGIEWRDRLGSIVLQVDPTLTPPKLGAAIARMIRERATQPEQAR